jgi:hypothetical protein
MKRSKVALAAGIAALVLVFGFFSMTGLYIDPPIPKKYPGQTIWFYRRLINAPFLFSADSVALENGVAPTPETRGAVTANVLAHISRFVLARFPFSRTLYLATTGNKDFLPKKGEGTP